VLCFSVNRRSNQFFYTVRRMLPLSIHYVCVNHITSRSSVMVKFVPDFLRSDFDCWCFARKTASYKLTSLHYMTLEIPHQFWNFYGFPTIGSPITTELVETRQFVRRAYHLPNVFNIGSPDWFKSYLCNRQQFTAIQNNVTKCESVTCGVPQGSVL